MKQPQLWGLYLLMSLRVEINKIEKREAKQSIDGFVELNWFMSIVF